MIEVHFTIDEYCGNSVAVYIIERKISDGEQIISVATKCEDGVLVFKRHEPGMPANPLFSVGSFEHLPKNSFIEAVAKGLKNAGYTDELFNMEKENELKATKYHLEDMRKLAFKK